MPSPNEAQEIQIAANAVRAQLARESILHATGPLGIDPAWKAFPHPQFHFRTKKPEKPDNIPLPQTLDFQSGPINFDGGTPVSGWCNLKLYQNGNYEYVGHFHDAGAPSYDAGFLWFIVDHEGQAYAFERKVHLNGTFEAGSRDGNWNDQGNSELIMKRWPIICAGCHSRWTANVNWDWNILVKQAKDAIEIAGTVVKSVATIVAFF